MSHFHVHVYSKKRKIELLLDEITHLKEENNNSKVTFGKHRIRGKKAENNDSKELEIDGDKLLEENYIIPKPLLDCTGLTYEELKLLLKRIAIQRLEKIINE